PATISSGAKNTTSATSMKRRNVISAPSEVPEANDDSHGPRGEPEEQADGEERPECTHERAEHPTDQRAEDDAAQEQRPRHQPARRRLLRPARPLAATASRP